LIIYISCFIFEKLKIYIIMNNKFIDIFRSYFEENYSKFIKEQIEEIASSNFVVDISKYTGRLVSEKTLLIVNFLINNNILYDNYIITGLTVLVIDIIEEKGKKLLSIIKKHNNFYLDVKQDEAKLYIRH